MMTKKQVVKIIAGTLCLLMSTGCLVKVNTPAKISVKSQVEADRLKFFIVGKKVSSLSEDGKAITLSIVAEDPDGGEIQAEWTQDKPFGIFNSTRGKDVQWSVERDGDYEVTLKVTVRGSLKQDDPDVAYFVIPVVNGRILATEMAPEITVSPQSLTLFRLPQNPPIPDDKLTQVKSSGQLTATTYIYDPETNEKTKQSGDFGDIKWLSGSANLVTVDDNGYLKPADGAATGSTLVTAAAKSNSLSKAACLVTVQYLDTRVAIERYSGTSIDLNAPLPLDLFASVYYNNPLNRGSLVYSVENQGITWSTSAPSIAQVSPLGVVTAPNDAQPGIAVITARSNYDPTKIATVSVSVSKP